MTFKSFTLLADLLPWKAVLGGTAAEQRFVLCSQCYHKVMVKLLQNAADKQAVVYLANTSSYISIDLRVSHHPANVFSLFF